jgi:hypothetical protein
MTCMNGVFGMSTADNCQTGTGQFTVTRGAARPLMWI